MDDTAIGVDLDFEDFAVFGAGERLERQPAARAESLVAGPFDDFLDDREVRMIAALGTRHARLLTAWSGWQRFGRNNGWGSVNSTGGGFALLAVKLLFEITNASLEV